MRVGIADHLGWAIAVTASADHEVLDRRQIALIEPGMSEAPIHCSRRNLGDQCVVRVSCPSNRNDSFPQSSHRSMTSTVLSS